MKTTKRYLTILITLCITFNIFNIASYAVSFEEYCNEDNFKEILEIHPSEEYEISPMVASNCPNYTYNYSDIFKGTPNSVAPVLGLNYVNFLHFDLNGIAKFFVHYTNHGNPKNHSNPHYHTFSFVFNEAKQAYFWQPNSTSIPGVPD